MPKFEYKAVPINLNYEKPHYLLGIEESREKVSYSNSETNGESYDPVGELGLQGWELICLWDKPEPYLEDHFDDENIPFIKLGVFKRQID
jgi:hypothetical protein